jgi:carbon-monoxide dehydrogenase medium subunit
VLEATVTIIGPTGSRNLALERFFKGPGEVDLVQGELLAEVHIPLPAAGSRLIYLKHGPRKAMDIAVVGVAVALSLDEANTRCEKARIALGAVAPTPVRIRKAEALLEGKKTEEIPFSEVAEAIQRGIKPISDVRGSAEYRSDVAATLTIRALTSLINAAEG